MKKNSQFINIINYLTIAFATLPLISNVLSKFLGGVAYIIISYIITFFAMLINSNKFDKKERWLFRGFVVFIIFAAFYSLGTQLFIDHFRKRSVLGIDISVTLYNFISNLPLHLCCFFLFLRSKEENRQKYFKFFFLCLLYTIIITGIALIVIPDFATNDTAAISTENMGFFSLLGASGYSLAYSLTVLVPIFFYFFFSTKKVLFILIGLSGMFVTIKSGFLIATSVLIFNCILCLIFSIKSNFIRRFLICVIFGIGICLIFNPEFVGRTLLFFADKITIFTIKKRLIQISNVFLYKDYSGDAVAGRIAVYIKTIDGINEHPIIGNIFLNDSFAESGHSTVLDPWADFGIIFFFLFVIFLVCFYFGGRNKKKRNQSLILLSLLLSFFLISLLDPILASAMVFNYLFIIFCFVTYKNKDRENLMVNDITRSDIQVERGTI